MRCDSVCVRLNQGRNRFFTKFRVGTLHIIWQSKHQLTTASTVRRSMSTNMTPGSNSPMTNNPAKVRLAEDDADEDADLNHAVALRRALHVAVQVEFEKKKL
jgi:hypothetical protein